MTSLRTALLLLVAAFMTALLAACGGGSGTTPPAISLAFTSGFTPPTSLGIGATAPNGIAATITNGAQNATVSWSCAPVSQCGTFSPTSTGSTIPTTYTAPSTVPAGGSVTITAASAGATSISATINITSSVAVTFAAAPPTSLLIDAAAINITANVANDPNNAGVNWTVTCGSAGQCGSFNPTSTLSGVATQYTDPADVPTGNTVTVTATSVTDNTKIATATITITSTISVGFSPGFGPPVSPINTNTQIQLAAAISNDPNSAGVNWTATCGSAQCGSFNPTTPTGNNVPVTYTAPLTVPTGGTVTVTATSVSDFNQTATGTITITGAPTTLPDGTYVFQLSGEDNNNTSPFNVAGAFTIQSGVITGGEQDFVDSLFIGSDAIAREGSSSATNITPTTDGNLQIVFDTGDTNIGVGGNGLETINVVLVNSSTGSGLLTWYDSFAAGTGTLLPQDPSAIQALPQYGYAFLTSGNDSTIFPVAIGGIVNVDSTTGTISGAGSVFDINDADFNGVGIVEQDQTLDASTVTGPGGGTTPDQFGSVLFTLNPSIASSVPEIGLVGYIIDSNTIALVETSDNFGGITGGIALAQGQSKTGHFGTSDLSGSAYVVGAQGQDTVFFLNFAGALTFNADTTVSGTATFNDLSAESSSAVTANYAVDAAGTGRATITNLAGTGLDSGSNSATVQLYLDGKGNALIASMDAGDVTAGPAYQQPSSPSFSGSYALGATGVSNATGYFWSAAGPLVVGSGGAIDSASSFTDFNYFGAPSTLTTDVALSGTAVAPSGTITGLGADSPSDPDTFDFYVIDNLRAFGIETDITQLGLLYMQQPPVPKPTSSKKHEKAHK